MSSSPYLGVFPAAPIPNDPHGVYPVDFILETVLQMGFDWFVSSPTAGNVVLGHLKEPYLARRYGQAKIDEIVNFLKKYPIKIVQHWSLIASHSPCISIQILDGGEDLAKTSLNDYARQEDSYDENGLPQRRKITYSPITDSIHIGIHNTNTPDLTKYLYQVLVYILNVYKVPLEDRGLNLGTFRATDISRLNEYLPENMFSRFVTFTVESKATFDTESLPLIDSIEGVQFNPAIADTGAAVTTIGDEGV